MTTRRPPSATRRERRKAETRQKLIDAAPVMLAEDTSQQASIQDITEAADIGFGSFHNHFTRKGNVSLSPPPMSSRRAASCWSD
jgi:AcrR family transcriptional regulator